MGWQPEEHVNYTWVPMSDAVIRRGGGHRVTASECPMYPTPGPEDKN